LNDCERLISLISIASELAQSTSISTTYEEEKAQYLQHFKAGNDERTGREEEIRMSPLFSLNGKYALSGQSTAIIDSSVPTDTSVPIDSSATTNAPVSTDTPAPTSTPALCNTSARDVFFLQYGLLGFHIGPNELIGNPNPILMHTDAPNSVFLCGSQGSGKSYTLSCMLENCTKLKHEDKIGKLDKPLAGVVFHYDVGSSNCTAEAASLATTEVPVRVLVSPSNYHNLKAAYAKSEGAEYIKVCRLRLQDSHLNAERMLRLMAFPEGETAVPLFMEVLQRLLRQRATLGKEFSFWELKAELENQPFAPSQKSMMGMRLDLLESFFVNYDGDSADDIFRTEPGTLAIVDLTDPFVDSATACVLFNVCLSLVKQNRPGNGMVIGIDEAHKFLNASLAAASFTEQLMVTIREQRHNGTRVLIATQEPTISERLLDLCSVSIVHHFNSPAWFNAIKDHLGGASSLTTSDEERKLILEEIVDLQVGESLVFSPSSYVCVKDSEASKLGSGVMKMMTRSRRGVDAGKSAMAAD